MLQLYFTAVNLPLVPIIWLFEKLNIKINVGLFVVLPFLWAFFVVPLVAIIGLIYVILH